MQSLSLWLLTDLQVYYVKLIQTIKTEDRCSRSRALGQCACSQRAHKRVVQRLLHFVEGVLPQPLGYSVTCRGSRLRHGVLLLATGTRIPPARPCQPAALYFRMQEAGTVDDQVAADSLL